MQSQKVMDQEINQLQNRYMRCAQACQDDAQDLMRGGTTVRPNCGSIALCDCRVCPPPGSVVLATKPYTLTSVSLFLPLSSLQADEQRVVQCFTNCSQKHISMLPAMMDRVRAMLEQ